MGATRKRVSKVSHTLKLPRTPQKLEVRHKWLTARLTSTSKKGFVIAKFLVFPCNGWRRHSAKKIPQRPRVWGGRGRWWHPMRSLKTLLYVQNTFTFDDTGRSSWFFWLISLKKQSVKEREEGKKETETNNRDTAAFNFLQHAVPITRSFQMHQLRWGWEWPWISTSLFSL